MPTWPSAAGGAGRTARTLPALLLAGWMAASLLATPLLSRADDAADGIDPRAFPQTGFRVDNDAFWSYFQARGGVRTFGYPASRDFTFLGCTSQFFQRAVMQQCGATAGVGTLNLLDEGLLPYTRVNGSTFPAADAALKATTPKVSDSTYAAAIVDFVRANAADTFDGLPVNFGQTFFNTLSPDVAGTSDPALLPLLDLEVWGAPTSKPAYDPANHNFVYQRFQRGIMHFDRTCQCTQGLLLADYLKAVATGQNLPDDLAAQAASSPLFRSAVGDGRAPAGTTYGAAFQPGGASSAQAPATPGSGVGTPAAQASSAAATDANPPAPVASPDFGLSMFLWGQSGTTSRDLQTAAGAGFHWQKTLFQWRQIEGRGKGQFDWSEADRVVQASTRAGVRIIARVDFQPDWARRDGAHNGPPDNAQDYADFIGAFASRYRPGSPNGTVDAIEVWNEPNITREWGNQPISAQSAADYVRLLTAAYRAAHAANPKITVLTAGLSPTGVRNADAWDDAEYLQWLFDAGLKGGVNYDALGAHGNTQAPCVECDLNSLPAFGHPSFYFRRVEQLRQVQVRNGDAARQVWLLEFGWTSDQVHQDYSWFAISEDQKAQNVVRAYQYARQNWTPWIGVMTLWTLADPTWTPQREEYWWAVTNPDGSARPAFKAVQAARASGQI